MRRRAVMPAPAPRADAVLPGSWVVVSDRDLSVPQTLAVVLDGPTYEHADGHALGALWMLHDRSVRHQADLVAFDMANVLGDATRLLRSVRGCARVDAAEVRGVCVAAGAARRVAQPSPAMLDPLHALIELDAAIDELRQAADEMIEVRLPNVARCLFWAGALEMCRRGQWEGAHPRWHEIYAEALGGKE